jgi:hypothetical protein
MACACLTCSPVCIPILTSLRIGYSLIF